MKAAAEQTLRLIWNGYQVWNRVLFKGEQPTDTSMDLSLIQLRAIGMLPSKTSEESISYTLFNAFMMVSLIAFVASITADLYEASSDIIMFGEDLCVLVGVYLILLKIFLYRIYKKNIIYIVGEFRSLLNKYSTGSEAIRKIQRQSYIRDIVIFNTFLILGDFLFVALAFQPIFSGEPGTLPFRAKYPFSLENKRTFQAVYGFQCFCTLICLKVIIYIDNVGCITIHQTAVNLEILCEKIREFGKRRMSREDLGEIIAHHQRIIKLIKYVNKYYYYNFVGQVGASTFLICLTAFEAQIAKDQPFVALKFQLFMIASFNQLFYWCWVGNQVRFNSLEVAAAAFECEWLTQPPTFRRDLMFLILRAQKPLSFRAQPLYGFDFEAFSRILSSSYSVFTMLRTFND
ncbi:odorant receptor 47b [Episyrphus balteatus]|uniref:odorant receptor 47b n=1 Tax=Episyrphus balteatus TaxID=286459 RepID=UPI002484FEEF|nr:odorant receptor 47b [Episyrphus balteatus]